MAKIVITTSSNSIIVAFNDYATVVGYTKSSYHIADIVELGLTASGILVLMRAGNNTHKWYLTYDNTYSGDDYFIIDTVAGVAPSSESDLFDKLTALRG